MASLADWHAACAALVAIREEYSGPDDVLRSFGVDPDALPEWAVADAQDSLKLIEATDPRMPLEVRIGSMLASHTQIGIELGLWLARTGRVPT